MVTVLDPTKRVVSICAYTAEDCPGGITPCKAVAVTQPHDTRTLVMRSVELVLLVRRYEWVSVGLTGTPPKSWLCFSNNPSAHVAAGAGRARTTPATAARQNRYMSSLSLCPDPDARLRRYGTPRRVALGQVQLFPPGWAHATGGGGNRPPPRAPHADESSRPHRRDRPTRPARPAESIRRDSV